MTDEALLHGTTTAEMNGVKRDFDDASWSNSQDDASQSPPIGNNGSTAAKHKDTRTAAGSETLVQQPPSSAKQLPLVQDDDDDDADYIVVTDREDGLGSKLELPAEPDGTLTIATLAHSFPDAIGLKFRNPTTGIFRALGVDPAGIRILAPKGGWRGREFVVIFRPKENAAIVTPSLVGGAESAVAPKRRLDDETGRESDSVAPMSKSQRLDEYDSPSVVRKTCDLVILNLPFKTTSEGLKAYFEKFGEVVVAEIKTDFRTGQPKGFGFVQMCEYEAQCKVLEQYEHFIDGRMTQVKIPNSRGRGEHDGQPPPSHHRPAPAPAPFPPELRPPSEGICTKMYVGRVPVNFTQEDIRSFFDKEAKKFGHHAQVEHVLIPKPHRGFAFVTFNDPEVTKKIIRISDFVINGVSVCVSAASPKEQQNQPPSQSQGPPPSGSYGYGYGYPGRGPPRDAPGYGPRDDQHWSGSGWSGHPGEPAGYGQPGGYAGYGSGYGGYGQGRGGAPPQPTAANMNDNNLQAAWSAFWATLQGQPGQSGGSQSAQSAMQTWQWAAAMGQNPGGQQPAAPDAAQPQPTSGTWPGKS